MSMENEPPPPRLGFLQIAVVILSVYVLVAMLAQMLLPLPPAVSQLLDRIDFFVCFVFLTDFAVSLHRAPSKLAFMKWGWIDLLASIPVWDALRWGRLARVVRIVRLLRAFRSTKSVLAHLYRDRARATFATAVLTVVFVMMFSSIAVLIFEEGADSTIKSPFDAVWWALSTVTTVGYGDKVPVTVEGRLVAIVVMLVGIGLFGMLTGLFAKMLVDPDVQREESEIAALTEEIRRLRERVEELAAERKQVARETEAPRVDSRRAD
jgi:voltage-gated potassium channel